MYGERGLKKCVVYSVWTDKLGREERERTREIGITWEGFLDLDLDLDLVFNIGGFGLWIWIWSWSLVLGLVPSKHGGLTLHSDILTFS